MLKIYIKTNLASSFIGPSKSHADTSILFVRKKDSSLPLFIDYQGLDNLIIKNCYLLFLIGKSLNCLYRVKRFTQLDLINAYHPIRIWEDDEWKTAFQIRYGYFEYQVMFFALFNASASFQSYVNKVLAKKLDVFVIVYLDDILIYIKNVNQSHVEDVQ